jgi:hypothetical protein
LLTLLSRGTTTGGVSNFANGVNSHRKDLVTGLEIIWMDGLNPFQR